MSCCASNRLQFFRDGPAALAEMFRVLRPEGTIAVSVWVSEQPLGLFGPTIVALRDVMPAPIPSAYDVTSYGRSAADLSAALEVAGFHAVQVETAQFTAIWESMEGALATIYGSLFGPPLSALPAAEQEHVRLTFGEGLGSGLRNGQAYVDTYANVARGIK